MEISTEPKEYRSRLHWTLNRMRGISEEIDRRLKPIPPLHCGLKSFRYLISPLEILSLWPLSYVALKRDTKKGVYIEV